MKQIPKICSAFAYTLIFFSSLPADAQRTATAIATVAGGFVVGISVTDGGSGYGWAPLVAITGGGGTGAGAFATISNSVVTAVTVTNAGSGYASVPQVIIMAPSTTPFSSSLILDLPLDGNAVDVGPYNFNVMTNGGGTFVTNRFLQTNSALSLNGVNQNIVIPYDARLYPDEMTLSAWVNFQQVSAASVWEVGSSSADSWRGFNFQCRGYDFDYADYTGSGYNEILSVSLTNFVVNTWSQVVITRTTNTAAVFVNGVKVASQTGLTPYAKPQITPMSLGADDNGSGGYSGYSQVTFDTVHIYNRALADSEVHTLFTTELGINPPSLTNQPGNQTSSAGSNAAFNVGASGIGLSYGWQFNGMNIAGATNATLNLTNVQVANEGGYQVMVSNIAGSTNSATALLRVTPSAPTITLQPVGQSVPATTNVSFTVAAIGSTPLSYQWRLTGTNIIGATNTTLSINNVQSSNAGTYTVLVSNPYGSTNSMGALLNIVPVAPVLTSQPTNQSVLAGSSTTFNVSAVGSTPFTYQWWFFGTNIIGATNAIYTLNNVQLTNAGNYSVSVSNVAGGIFSSNALLTVFSVPVITMRPTNQIVLLGTNVTFQVGANGTAPLVYQWYFNGVKLAGMTNTSLVLTNVQSFNTGIYTVTVTNLYGSATTNASLMVLPPAATVVAWGDDSGGQIDAPDNLTNVISVAGGNYHSLALKMDGTVVGWGLNGSSQAVPPAGLSNVIAIAAGDLHSLALKSDGTVLGWGDNTYGQATPPGSVSNAIAISAGSLHSLALRSDGSVVGWGANNYGQATPPTSLSNVVAIAAGEIHSLAIKNDGTVVGWGNDAYGQLDQPSNLSNVVAIAGGYFHSIALRSDGSVVGWGDNTYGQSTPPAGLSNVVAITAGEIHSVALKRNGTVVNWGDNSYGQLNIPAGLSNVVSIAAGYYHTLALTRNVFIISQPMSLTLPANAPAVFNVAIRGVGPQTFQWLFNGLPLSGATNFTLTLSSIQPTNVGNYDVVVSNPYASLTSSNAMLTVLPFLFSTSQTNLQLTSAGFQLKLSNAFAPNSIVISCSTNLINWVSIYTNPPATGSLIFLDPMATNFLVRFYKAQEQ